LSGAVMDTRPMRRKRPCDPFPVWKRVIDVAGATMGLILLSPLLFLIAATIKAVSPGPALLKQKRIGRHGKPFMLWKFRTMRPDANPASHQDHLKSLIAADTPMIKLDVGDDPRIFPFGRILRRCYLDELPQLINVLRGEMSLVGPRPCMPYEAAHYKSWHKRRFAAVPGMTGLWQVSGKNKTTFSEMIFLDVFYASRVSFLLDAKILLSTIPAILAERT
jgi:lipopolysaccharide/colanic/teichoic acid biosynthesis glycosyltransferase